jgi:GxxExxY protein
MAEPQSSENNALTYEIIGCAIAVHKELGPGLLESVYEEAFYRKLSDAGLTVEKQPKIRVPFEGELLRRSFRPDFLVGEKVVVEIKSVASVLPLHQAQLLTYMKLARVPLGLIINFNVLLLTKGVKRLIMTKAP